LTSSEHVAVHSPLARTRTRIAAVPIWLWLGALVVVSAGIRLALAKSHPAPWIFGDELVYSNLAESVGRTGSFAFRDSPGLHGYGPGYPLLISPAYAVFDDLAHAYAAAKAINAFLMSLAAIPVYLIARRLVSVWLAVAAAVLAITIPSFIYTGTIMTENAFYPAFLACVFAFLAALERPTVLRQLGALAFVGVAFLIRAQAVTLLPAFLTAIVLVCFLEAREERRLSRRELIRRLDAFRVTWLVLGIGLVLVLGFLLVRGDSPADALGAYGVLAESDYSPSAVARWFVLHLAELDLYLGILPFAALIALGFDAFGREGLPRPLRLFGVLAVSIVIWVTLFVAATVSYLARSAPGRIEERNLFHLAPLFLIALVVWVARRLPRAWPAAAVAALLAGGLPGVIPYNELAILSALSDTLVMIPLWNLVFFGHIQSGSLPILVTVCSLAAAMLFIALPRRLALLPAALVFGWFILLQVPLEHQIAGTSRGVLEQGLSVRREWIDEAVGGRAQVAALWTGTPSPMTVIQNGFFNRSLHPVYTLEGAPPVGLSQRSARIDEQSGALRAEDGRPVTTQYALADSTLEVAGREVARDSGRGLTLYRVGGDVRFVRRVTGMYADSWTGAQATYTRWRCRGGGVLLSVASQPGLFEQPQTVVAQSGRRMVGKLVVTPTGPERTALLPLLPSNGRCVLRLFVSPTAIPAQVLGIPDDRALGVRVSKIEYRPPRAS
jgi:4-amino-4-deoxy-L-arabinose transferase-like glycosyltransferase